MIMTGTANLNIFSCNRHLYIFK